MTDSLPHNKLYGEDYFAANIAEPLLHSITDMFENMDGTEARPYIIKDCWDAFTYCKKLNKVIVCLCEDDGQTGRFFPCGKYELVKEAEE